MSLGNAEKESPHARGCSTPTASSVKPSSVFGVSFPKPQTTSAMAIAALLASLYFLLAQSPVVRRPTSVDFSHLAAHCDNVQPITVQAFIDRQEQLAQTLHSLGASAYIAEPGANAAYFANLTGQSWYLSERPLLLLITPTVENGAVSSKVSILTPSFEATRARLLPIPSDSEIAYPEWPEDADPYKVAISAIPSLQDKGGLAKTIYIDGAIRHFVVDGLQKAAGDDYRVVTAPVEIRRLRERKRQDELDILKCVNEVTVLAIRAARKMMYIGMRESEAQAMVNSALTAAGLINVGAITLFGANAALPHGSGTNRVLGKSDLILIDCGGVLHGYHSDVTRTFALDDSEIPVKHLDLWDLVFEAQTSAFLAAHDGTVTADVDRAARLTISADGYGRYFTHRLGHGIGLETHESPYLRGGSEDIILTGNTFSDEPGIYIEREVGIRLEDCFYIDDKGSPAYLTAGVGGQAGSPWEP